MVIFIHPLLPWFFNFRPFILITIQFCFSFCSLEVNLHTYLTTWLSSCLVGIFFGFSHCIAKKSTIINKSNQLKCAILKSTHIRPLGWFIELPPNSVINFKILTSKFIMQYTTSQPHHTSSMSLLKVKQEKGESLRAFMDRFSKVCMGIKNLMPEIAMHHLVSVIRPGQFTESLIKSQLKIWTN